MLTQPFIDTLLSGSEAKIEFDNKRCLRSRFNKNNCLKCIENCQRGALGLHGRQVVFDADKCTHCMQCAAVCPNDAFTNSLDLLSMLQHLAGNEPVSISCDKGIHTQKHLTVPCIGVFSEPILAAVNSVAKGDCFIDINRCSECANGHCLKTLHENMQNLIHKMEGKGKIRLRYHFDKQPDFPPSENQQTERRSFLRLVGKTIADMGREAVSFQFENSGETKKMRGKERVRKTAALRYALASIPDGRMYERDILLSYFFSVRANEQCDCCPSCTGMCPTGALKRKKENDKKLLTFTSARCNGCGLCVNFCRKSALTLKAGFSGDPNITLRIA